MRTPEELEESIKNLRIENSELTAEIKIMDHEIDTLSEKVKRFDKLLSNLVLTGLVISVVDLLIVVLIFSLK
jgi:predicted RNase H-like nuclease (RuvC/YqgF family)